MDMETREILENKIQIFERFKRDLEGKGGNAVLLKITNRKIQELKSELESL